MSEFPQSLQSPFTPTFFFFWFIFPAPPHLIEKPQDVQKLIDDSLVWECKATGKPKPSYRWMKNGENLEPAEVRPAKRLHVFRPKDRAALLQSQQQSLAQTPLAHSVPLSGEREQPCGVFSELHCVACSSFTD